MGSPAVVVRRGADRPVSAGGGVTSRHGLSFGAHYDPERTSFGALVAHNDDRLEPGVAYGAHTHADVEILTWVLSGAMAHVGPSGRVDVVEPGTLQVLSAGTGWHHDERCAGSSPVHLVQLWIAPGLSDPPAAAPALTHASVDLSGGPVVVAGGPAALVPLRRAGVTVSVARLAAGSPWSLPSAAYRHAYVARGDVVAGGHRAVDLEGATGGERNAGDSVGATGGEREAGAGDTVEVTGESVLELLAGDEGAEVLVVATACDG